MTKRSWNQMRIGLSITRLYDGYHFSYDAEGIYNPFSLLNALYKKNFGLYWFATATPTFLIDKLKDSGFDN